MALSARATGPWDSRLGLDRVLRGAGLTMGLRVGGAALSLITQVVIARWVGQFEYGIFTFSWSCVALLAMLASLGLDRAAVRFVPEYLATESNGHLAGVIRSFRGGVLGGGVIVAGLWCLGILGMGGRIPEYLVAPLCVASLSIPLFAQLNLHSEMARGFGWVGLAYAPETIVRQSLMIVLVGTGIALGGSRTGTTVLVAAGLATLGAGILQGIVFHWRLPERVREAAPTYRARRWLRTAVPLFLTGSAGVLMLHTDVVLLGLLSSPNEVATYGAAGRIATVTSFIFFAMSALSVPRFAGLWSERRLEELETLLASVVRWIFWPSAAVVCGLLLFGKPILGLFGESFVAGYSVLAVLAVASLCTAAVGPIGELLQVTGNHDAAALTLGGGAALNLTLNLALIPTYGPIGAAVATSTSWIAIRVCQFVIVRQRLGIRTLPVALR